MCRLHFNRLVPVTINIVHCLPSLFAHIRMQQETQVCCAKDASIMHRLHSEFHTQSQDQNQEITHTSTLIGASSFQYITHKPLIIDAWSLQHITHKHLMIDASSLQNINHRQSHTNKCRYMPSAKRSSHVQHYTQFNALHFSYVHCPTISYPSRFALAIPMFTGHGSHYTDNGSHFTDHKSQLTDHSSLITAHGSQLMDHGSRCVIHNTRIRGQYTRFKSTGRVINAMVPPFTRVRN